MGAIDKGPPAPASFADQVVDAMAPLLFRELDRYRITSHGHNRWTLAGVQNVQRFAPYMERARQLVSGTFGSVYRSPEINIAVGGVVDSFHKLGAACDISPGNGLSFQDAAAILLREAQAGRLGPVHEIVREGRQGIVHIDWYTGRVAAPPRVVDDERF